MKLAEIFSRFKKKDNYLIEVSDGKKIPICLQRGQTEHNYYLFALHKSGSVLLNKMMADLCGAAKVPFVDVPGIIFREGNRLKEVSNHCDGLFGKKGVCFAGFRHWPPPHLGVEVTEISRSVFLVRDPRDILVSYFFSMMKSHALPEEGTAREKLLEARELANVMDIDDYVLDKADFFASQFDRYRTELLDRDDREVQLFRYEDMIFEKERWLREINEFFGWSVSEDMIAKIAAKHDARPDKEDTGSHIRRVTPGDHKEKLKPETIEKLNDLFREAVKPFGYSF